MISKYYKTFFFSSKFGVLYFAHVFLCGETFIINVCNSEKQVIGEVRLSCSDKRLFYIYNLFMSDNYRNEHLGSRMIEILDYLIRDYECKNIYGVFEPFELYKTKFDMDKLKDIARKFYHANNFLIIDYIDYVRNKEMYNEIKRSHFGASASQKIIYRNFVPEQYMFNELGNVLVHNSVQKRLGEIESFVDSKLHKLSLKVQ